MTGGPGRGQVAGVVYDPYADELFAAAAGCGAFCNGRPIRCGEEARIEEAVVAAGRPALSLSLSIYLSIYLAPSLAPSLFRSLERLLSLVAR